MSRVGLPLPIVAIMMIMNHDAHTDYYNDFDADDVDGGDN